MMTKTIIVAALALASLKVSAMDFAGGSGSAASHSVAGSSSYTGAMWNGYSYAGGYAGAENHSGVAVDAETSNSHGATLDLDTYSYGSDGSGSYVYSGGYAGGYAGANAYQGGYGNAYGYVYDYAY